MATRKKSDSGAYMSQYDTEVERRLKALESHTHDATSDGTALTDLKKAVFENSVPPGEFEALKKRLDSIAQVVKDELRPDLDL